MPRPYLSKSDHNPNLHVDVDLALGSDEKDGARWRSSPPLLFGALPPQPMFVMGMVASILYLVVGTLTRLVSVQIGSVWMEVAFLITAAFLVSGGVVYFRVSGARPPKSFVDSVPKKSDLSKRVRIVGPARVLYAARPQPAGDFEPQVFLVPFALPDRRTLAIIAYAVLSAALMGVVVVFQRFGLLPKNSGPWNFWAAMGVASLPLALAWPTYLRVAPGRLDVLRYPFLGSGAPTITKLDLRSSRVVVNVAKGVIRIGPVTQTGVAGLSAPEAGQQLSPSAAPEAKGLVSSAPPSAAGATTAASADVLIPDVVIPIGFWVPRRAQLARAIAEGAVSTASTPPLPDDALSG